MAIKLDDFNITTEDGTQITGDMVKEWEKAYSEGHLPEGYKVDGPVHTGRPKLYDEDMTIITVRIPVTEKDEAMRKAERQGISLSAYVRDAIDIANNQPDDTKDEHDFCNSRPNPYTGKVRKPATK